MNEESKILAGRYELGQLIGRGGMAEVHVGYDTRLGRTVAIKILRADLARDPSFQTRFRREAQAAAGLNHPSIVAVYDTGEDTIVSATGHPQAVPFIVMEYVEGHTVREILKGDVAAPIDEAIEITAGVLTALDYSHHAGLVHRDIKPANIMLTPTGAVKVMDFGIARAMADAGQTMTQTQAVVGTAQYLSPEQARGETVDARSDLYSTGCVLFELLTGRPPFVGDSPVSVAYQHVREPAPRPSQFAADVPEALDLVVMRALAKNRDERYSTAQEFLSDLRAVLGGDPLSPSTGAIALGAAALGAGAGALAAQANATEVMPIGADTNATEIMPGQPWAGVDQPGSVEPATAAVDVLEDEEDEEARRRKKRMQWIILAGALVAVGLLIAALSFITRGEAEPEPSITATTVEIPALEGKTEAEALRELSALGLVPTFTPEASDTVEKDLVTRTDPPAGQMLEAGASIVVFLSAGPDVVVVPDVRGFTEEQAIKALEAAGLKVTRVDTKDDGALDKGRAVETDPAKGTEVAVDSAVKLFVSSGQVDLPNLVGKSESAARKIITELGLIPSVTYKEFAQGPFDEVESHDPAAGRVPRGATITITVSKQASTVTVPNVVGKSQSAASNDLTAAGLTLGNVSVDTGDPQKDLAGMVKSSNPRAGANVKSGEKVDLVLYCDVKAVDPDPDTPDAPVTYVCK